jgi:hypothetical protein
VDFVRVFQCSSQNADGTGCAGVAAPLTAGVENPETGAPLVNDFALFPNAGQAGASAEPVSTALQFWEEVPGNVLITSVDEGERGSVTDVNFLGLANVFTVITDTVAAAPSAVVLGGGSGWSNVGTLEFDLFVESIDPGTQLLAKMDSGYPNLGQVILATPPVGQWTHVVVALADLLGNPGPEGAGLDLANVVNPLVLEPTGTHLAHVRLDDVKLRCAVSADPLPWQTDTSCGLSSAGGVVIPPSSSTVVMP